MTTRWLAILVLVLLHGEAGALLCAGKHGTVASRPACKAHETAVNVAALLPTSSPPPTTTIGGGQGPVTIMPVTTPPDGTQIGAVGHATDVAYLVIGTATVMNQGVSIDTATCVLLEQDGSHGPFGLRLTGDTALSIAPGTSAEMVLIGELPGNLAGSLQNGSGTVTFWCSSASSTNLMATSIVVAAIPAAF